MTDEAAMLKSAIEQHASDDFDTRCEALTDIVRIAMEGESIEVKSGAIRYLHESRAVAVIEDAPQPPVLATVNGVHIESRVG